MYNFGLGAVIRLVIGFPPPLTIGYSRYGRKSDDVPMYSIEWMSSGVHLLSIQHFPTDTTV